MATKNKKKKVSPGASAKAQAIKGSLPPASFVAPVNVNQYKAQSATIKDLSTKYGIDYSRQYAARQAEAEAQARRAGLQNEQKTVDKGVQQGQKQMSRNYFQEGMAQAQAGVNGQVNAGLMAEGNLRLGMNAQAELSDLMGQAAIERNRIAQEQTDTDKAEKTRSEQIYQERLAQAVEQIGQINDLNLQEKQMLLSAALKQREQNIDQSQFSQKLNWDKYQFNNMSASDKANLDWEKYQFNNMSAKDRAGLEWQKYQFNNISAADQAQNKLAYAQLEEEKRQFNSEQDWREYTYKHMSASEKAKLNQDAEQFGADMAWKRYELDYTSEMKVSEAQAHYGGGSGWTPNLVDGKYRQSSGYGYREHPVDGGRKFHKGVDIAVPEGTGLNATVGGTVVYAGYGKKGSGYGDYGNVVAIRDSKGNIHLYAHLGSVGVKVGQRVGAGGFIGVSGNTGKSSGAHLHYEVRTRNGGTVNPTSYLN